MILFTSMEFTIAAAIMSLAVFLVWIQLGLRGTFKEIDKMIFIVCNGLTLLLIGFSLNLASTAWEYIATIPPLLVATFGLLVQTSSKLSTQPAYMKVGNPITHFSGTDENGIDVDVMSLIGEPFVIKFFRGHWCPFCIGELRQWEKHQPELSELGIKNLLFISQDTPNEIKHGKRLHNLDAIQVSDSNMEITDLFNLRNTNRDITSYGQDKNGFSKPTTILVNERGVISWIGQSDDLQVRNEVEDLIGFIKSVDSREQASATLA